MKLSLPSGSVRAGFTLIETLVAIVIMAVILGAATTANRVTQRSASVTETTLQMNGLAEEPIDNFKLLRDGGVDLGVALGLAASGTAATTTGAFVSQYLNNVGPCDGGVVTCPAPENAGPLTLSWCNTDTSNAACNTRLAAAADGASGVRTLSGTGGIFSTVATTVDGSIPAEMVAVRRTIAVAGSPSTEKRQLVDMSSIQTGSLETTSLYAASSANKAEWNFYKRSVQITRLGSTDSAQPLFTQAGTPAIVTALRQATYVITVIVQDYYSPQVSTVHAYTLTDWK